MPRRRNRRRNPGRAPGRAAPLLIAAAVAGALAPLAPVAVEAQQPPPATAAAGAAIAIRVLDAGSGRALAGAELALAPLGAADGAPRGARTTADGVARLAGLPAGRYTLTARSLGFRPQRLEVAVGGRDTALVVRLAAAPRALDQIVVTAARRPQRLADVAVTTEVVGREEILQTGASDMASVLTEQTGIQLQGGHPSGAGVMLQGIGSERVLVLLDGQPLVGRISGNFDVSRIPTAMVQRVEVVKGPQSTLYGSEAMGGVINIVTRRAPEESWGASASVIGGTEGRADGNLGLSYASGPWNATVDAGRRLTDRAPGRAEEAGALADRMDGAATLRWSRDSALSVEASALVLSERQRWKAGAFHDFADNTQLGGRVTANARLGERHRLTPSLHFSEFDHLARRAEGTSPIAGTGNRQTQQLLEAELLYSGAMSGYTVDAGVELRQEYLNTTDGRIDAGNRTLRSAEPFAQVEIAGERWSVVPGARLTWNEQWGSQLTPHLALRWRASDAVTFRASAGQGFRAPDFKELYLQFTNDAAGYAVYGNAELQPEHSDNLTAGVEWTGNRLYARGQLFWNRLRDFIETRPVPSTGSLLLFEYANVEQGLTQGGEVEAGMVLGALRLEGAYSHLLAEDRQTGRSLLGRPRHSGRATASYALPVGLRGSLAGVYTGETPMERAEDGAVTSTRDAFLRVDARLAQRLPQGLELVLGVDNLFDRQPAQWAGAVGRQLYTGVSWSFARDTK